MPAPDVILVLGGNLARIRTAAALARRHAGARVLIATNDLREGEAMRRYLADHGIGGRRVWVEDRVTDTVDTFILAEEHLARWGARTVCVVTDRRHFRRAMCVADGALSPRGYSVTGCVADTGGVYAKNSETTALRMQDCAIAWAWGLAGKLF